MTSLENCYATDDPRATVYCMAMPDATLFYILRRVAFLQFGDTFSPRSIMLRPKKRSTAFLGQVAGHPYLEWSILEISAAWSKK